MESQPDPQPSLSTSSTTRPSGLPRPSRLPLPKSSIPNLRQQASFGTLSRPTSASIAKTRGAAPSPLPRSRPALSSAQTNNRTPAHLRTISTASSQDGTFRKPSSRPLSRANLQAKQRPLSVSSSKASTTVEDDLGSMHSFRSDATYSTATTSPAETPVTPTFKRTSRPSLSERTIESLASIPPSPASTRRQSNFFSPDSPMVSRSRPASGFGHNSRPTSRDELMPPPPLATPRALHAKPSMPILSSSVRGTPSRLAPGSLTSKTLRARSPTKASTLRAVDKEGSTPLAPRLATRGAVKGSKTVAGRVPLARGSVADLFGGEIPKASPAATPKSALKPRLALKRPGILDDGGPSPKAAIAAKSSLALREQIKMAKASRLSSTKPEVVESDSGFDATAFKDPFNQKPKDERSVIHKRVDAARADGRLNISALNLKEIPVEVLKMYDYEFNKEDTSIQWNEVMDLTRFVAADNEVDNISDSVFPDFDVNEYDQDDDTQTPKFGGIEILDLHGNNLFDVPMGLRRLQCLTSLNLSRNRLMNDALETIAQISSLRELKISDNLLTGELTFIESLTNLEVLEIQNNKISVLPDEIRDLVKLRLLNVSNNQLTELPIVELCTLPLTELLASKNQFKGTLFTAAGTTMSKLTTLDISANRLTALYDGTAGPEFPALRVLNIAFNQMTSLPDLSSWNALTSILAQDNHISELPLGFTESTSLVSVDFSGNDFTRVDERVAGMDGLAVFKVQANPLRERKFLTMSTADLKKDLAARLEGAGFGA